jgi:putative ABC transport system permease protein
MNLIVGALSIGFLLALVSLGVFLSFRVLRSLDLTTDGAFATGAAVAGALLAGGHSAPAATLGGCAAGAACGAATGLIHTRWKIDVILAGILVTTALYSVDIWAMGGGNLSLAGHPTVVDQLAGLLPGDPAAGRDWVGLGLFAAIALLLALGFSVFAVTDLGLALRATGNSPRMAKAAAIDTGLATVLGLTLANGCTGLAGALFAQYQGFANVQMGIGMIVTGLASLILGEALFPRRTIRQRIFGAVLGAVAFRLVVAAALQAGLDPNALKLVTAAFVLAALTLPAALRRLRPRRAATGPHG